MAEQHEQAIAAPKRIQRKRTKGWRMPEGAVYVGRPTKWGNPFRLGTPNADDCMVGYREDIVAKYRSELVTFGGGLVGVTVEDIRRELAGKDLACFCPLDQPCHADVLLEIANPAADVTCEHGVAMDVHCCGCHSGFLFDSRKCVCF